MPLDSQLKQFEKGLSGCYKFRKWPNNAIPDVTAGVYVIWEGENLLYVGMSGRGMTPESIKKTKLKIDEKEKAGQNITLGDRKGLFQRLRAHASGRLSVDQFCVYVANRRIAPEITSDQQKDLKNGCLTFDELVRKDIDNLDYQFYLMDSGKEAIEIESRIRKGEITKWGKPYLNPL